MKQYKLLKDLPDLKAGAIFIKGSEEDGDYHCQGEYRYDEDVVENNPEWFEEVKEEYEKSVAMTFIDTHYIDKDKIRDLIKDRWMDGPGIAALEELIK